MVMTIGTGVFVLNEASALVPMQPTCFASEDDFQDLLGRFPALLAGDQMNSGNPRRFILIDREQPIASEPGGPGRWSLDHLFLDQDGVPTLVEVKRSTETRIRREVVGQMFDYAANAILHWPAEELRARFEARCVLSGRTHAEVLGEELGVEPDVDAFWANVKSNLQAGRIRMLFAADRIPPELRKVVEFLNAQMCPAEVLAVELRQFLGGGLRTLAPIVFGQTQETIDQKSGGIAKPRRPWDEARLLEAPVWTTDAAVAATARAVIDWMKVNADRVAFNDAPSYGSATAEIDVGSETIGLMRLWTDGGVAISFAQLKLTPAFADLAARQALLDYLAVLPDQTIRADAIEKQTTIRIAGIAADAGASFLAIMDWAVETLRGAQGARIE